MPGHTDGDVNTFACALRTALAAALAIHDEGREEAEAARATAADTNARFDRFLNARDTGDRAAQSRAMADQARSLAGFRAMTDRSRRRVTALCDAYDAVMRLYAVPQAREAAEQVAARLREIQLLDIAEFEVDTPEPFEPPPTDLSRAQQRAWDEARVGPFMAAMHERAERTIARNMRRADRIRELLVEAIDIAERLQLAAEE